MRFSSRSPQNEPLIGLGRWTFHFFFLLKALLAAKTVLSPRQSIKPPGIDFFATGSTHAENALLNSSQRCLDHAYHESPFATLLEQRFLGKARDTTIPDVLGMVRIHTARSTSQSIKGPYPFFASKF
jgi:hypothetical protein